MHKYILIFIFFIANNWALAQATLKHLDILKQYKEAKEHIALGRYSIAYPIIQNFLIEYQKNPKQIDNHILADAIFIKATCAKATQATDATVQLLYFVDNYPGNPNIPIAYFLLGEIAFGIPNYQDALEYFKLVDKKQLSTTQAESYEYKEAFALFALKKFKEARPKFNAIANAKSYYKEDAAYYAGLCAYYTNDYNAAYKSFQQLENSPKYNKIIPYYIASIQFINKDYQTLVDYVEPKLKEKIKYTTEITHLLGNSYFELQQFDKSKFYLEQYMKESVKATPEDYYILGYVQAKENDCKSAVKNLEQLSSQETELGQNAMYQLAKCNVKLNNKSEAKDAFLQAARLNFNKAIQEESIFQYAKLAYELNSINEALITLKKFIVDYPKSTYYNEANELLADIFLITKNYDEAMQIIEKLPTVSVKLQNSYQQMAFQKSLNLYNDRKFDEADITFNKALKYNPNKSYEASTYYWKADIAHQKNNYTKSRELLEKFFLIYKNILPSEANVVNEGTANYLQGYNYYKEKNYANAATFFSKSLNSLKNNTASNINQTLYPDALLRLADAYFIQKQYKSAEMHYDVVVKNNFQGADYALYQKSIIDGLNAKYNDKIAGMNTLVTRFPASSFADDAMFQSANTHFSLNNLSDAKLTFNSLLQKYPTSDRVPETYIKLGLIEYNQNNYDQALNWYKKVVEKYPNTPSSNEALLAIKDIYIEKGDANAYIKYATKNGNTNLSSTAQDSIIYLSAENLFQKGNTQQALVAFNNYLLQYPNGFFSLQAKFYRAECYFNLQQFEKALPDYLDIASAAQNRFSERSTVRTANIFYFDKKDYAQAKTYYTKLESIATLEENKRECQIGLMRTNFKLKNYANTLIYAEKVKVLPNLPDFFKKEVAYHKGMAHFHLKEYDKSLPELQFLTNTLNNEQGAEAQYSIAKIFFEKKNTKQAEAECLKYNDLFPSYEYYLGKSYILLSDIYKINNKILQAKATLQSLIDNYSFDDDVMKEAKDKLQIIISEENKKSNLKLPNNSNELQFDKQ